jgi:rhamnogalacturonan endolyase
VKYKIGRDDPVTALNYFHRSVFGGKANYKRPQPIYDNINNWTILFGLDAQQLHNRSFATFTLQLAGAKTAAGNTDVFNSSEQYPSFSYAVTTNG